MGVVRTRVGYAGGTKPNPTYHDLGDHTEAIQIDFDPTVVSYEKLLEVFWTTHNPCSQPWSRQYASILFVHDDVQRALAEKTKAEREKALGKRIATEILPYTGFTRAEEYHQKYSLRHDAEVMAAFAKVYGSDREFVDSTAAARVNAYLAGDLTGEEVRAELERLSSGEKGDPRLKSVLEVID